LNLRLYPFAPLTFGKSANSLEQRRDDNLTGLVDETPSHAAFDSS
jgi:hypothetical protein